jgi:hypothetical protein
MSLERYHRRLNVDRLGPLPNVAWTEVDTWAKQKPVKDHFGPDHERFLKEVTDSLRDDFRHAPRGLPMKAVVDKLVAIKVRVS